MKATEAIEELGRPVSYYPKFAKIFGMPESVFIFQMIYWKGKEKSKDGWIYKTREEIEEETGLTYKQQIRVRKTLLKSSILEERYSRSEHRMYFKINNIMVNKIYSEKIHNGSLFAGQLTKGKVPVDQRSSRSHTESTTEITDMGAAPKKLDDFGKSVQKTYDLLDYKDYKEFPLLRKLVRRVGIKKFEERRGYVLDQKFGLKTAKRMMSYLLAILLREPNEKDNARLEKLKSLKSSLMEKKKMVEYIVEE